MSDAATTAATTASTGTATSAAATSSTSAGSQSTPAPASTALDWTVGLNDEMKGFVQNKGFKGPQDVLESYRNFEKTMGAKAEHLLKLPENMDTPEGRAVWERLGAPKEAKDYKIEIPKEHGDEKLAEAFREVAHKHNFTHKQMEGLVGWWNERTGGQIKAMQEQQQTQTTDALNNLKKEWGSAFDQNKTIADQAALKFGLGEKEITALGTALGRDKALMLLHNLGKSTGEAPYHSSNGATQPGILAPSAAQAEIKALSQDPSFAKRLTSGDLDAKQKWNKLHVQAFGASPAQ